MGFEGYFGYYEVMRKWFYGEIYVFIKDIEIFVFCVLWGYSEVVYRIKGFLLVIER